MCTGIRLKTKNNSYVYGRTLEFGQDLQSHILMIPRNYALTSLAPSGKPEGLAWKSHYAVVGANAFDTLNFIDGVNEQGLAGGLFYFPGFAGYQEVSPAQYGQSLPIWQLLTWILTQCATVAQVTERLPKLLISKTPFAQMGMVPPAHLIVHDASGASIVIEYINGVLNMHDNPLGVITNSPDFGWHMTNVRNYLNLSVLPAPEKQLSGIRFAPVGQGSGMVGMPGDFTPPSRFIRAVAFSQATPQAASEQEAIAQVFHILNNFDIPIGTAQDNEGHSDHTLWTSVSDLKNKVFYFRPYAHFQLQKVELQSMDLDASKPLMMTMAFDELITNRTA